MYKNGEIYLRLQTTASNNAYLADIFFLADLEMQFLYFNHNLRATSQADDDDFAQQELDRMYESLEKEKKQQNDKKHKEKCANLFSLFFP